MLPSTSLMLPQKAFHCLLMRDHVLHHFFFFFIVCQILYSIDSIYKFNSSVSFKHDLRCRYVLITFYGVFCFQLKSHAFVFHVARQWKRQNAIYTAKGFSVSRRVYWISPLVWGMQGPDYSSSIWTSLLISTAPTQHGRPRYSRQGERDGQTGSDRSRFRIPGRGGVDFLVLVVTWSHHPLKRPEVCGLTKNVFLTAKGITRTLEFPPFIFFVFFFSSPLYYYTNVMQELLK